MAHPLLLKPRAVAVLCALRSGPRTTSQLRLAIGDGRKSDPKGLLASLRSAPLSFIEQRPNDNRWHLTSAGVEWLEANGLELTDDQTVNS